MRKFNNRHRNDTSYSTTYDIPHTTVQYLPRTYYLTMLLLPRIPKHNTTCEPEGNTNKTSESAQTLRDNVSKHSKHLSNYVRTVSTLLSTYPAVSKHRHTLSAADLERWNGCSDLLLANDEIREIVPVSH